MKFYMYFVFVRINGLHWVFNVVRIRQWRTLLFFIGTTDSLGSMISFKNYVVQQNYVKTAQSHTCP